MQSSPSTGPGPSAGAEPPAAAYRAPGLPSTRSRGPDVTSPADRRWAAGAHLSLFLLPVAGPLVVKATRGWHSPWVRAHALEALNFQITCALTALGWFVVVVLTLGLGLLWYAAVPVLAVVAATRAARGRVHRYPVTVRLLRR